MALELRQQLKLSQQLVMTPQLQMAIKLLQLNRLELIETIRQELEENPTLEEVQEVEDKKQPDEQEQMKLEQDDGAQIKEVSVEEKIGDDFDWNSYIDEYNSTGKAHFESEKKDTPSFENFLASKESLNEHLLWQLRMVFPNEEEEKIGNFIIGSINSDGYLEVSIDDIAKMSDTPSCKVEEFLNIMQQTFDPSGVFARDLKECLLIQARHFSLEHSIVNDIISNHLSHVENRNFNAISKALNIDIKDVISAVNIIKKFEPKPGRQFADTNPQYIVPDIYVYRLDNEFAIVLNDDGMPRLSLNSFYQNAVRRGGGSSAKIKEYLEEKIRSATWLLRSIHQRQKTIFRVMESILKFQHDFFEKGVQHLKPLILRDVAEDIEMHESTISRVTTNKYVYTPHGIFELKYFFNSSINRADGSVIASASVQEKIRQIVKSEDPRKPYSDDKISKILKSYNIIIARRTVSKYREALNLLPSNKRKQF